MKCIKQLSWLAPFFLLGLISLVLLRPWPVFPAPTLSRTIIDGNGTKVAIPLPFRGVIPKPYRNDFLQKTHASDAVLSMGEQGGQDEFARTLVGRIYPQLAENDRLWDSPPDTEAVLAQDTGGIYFTGDRRLGLTVVSPCPPQIDSINAYIFAMTRVMNDVVGNPARAESIISGFQSAEADLKHELHVETITHRPRVIYMVYSFDNWSHLWTRGGEETQDIGTADGAKGLKVIGREGEAERILAMNPDLIVLNVGRPSDFLRDPRWQGLKAVQTKRVYGNVAMRRYTFDVDFMPLGTRWLAEIAHPERLQPELREQMRDHFQEAYGYSLSDSEIDDMLSLDINKPAVGYSRFLQKSLTSTKRGAQQ